MSQSILAPLYTGQASAKFFTICACVLQPAKRHASSYRRTRSRLNVKPDASFLPSKTEPHDHIIFNPPPSAPNVYHTPLIFLPKNDKRRQMQNPLSLPGTSSATDSSTATSTAVSLAPPVRSPHEKRYHVTEAEVLEMQALRKEDPMAWSVSKLAKKYDCSGVFVQDVVRGLAPEKAAQQKQLTAVIKSRWGPKRRIAREDRAIRKERWLRDA